MSRNDDMTIRFSGLKSGVYTYDFELDDTFFSNYENDELKGGDVKIAAKMERKEHLLMFTFELKGDITTWCDRCLGDLKVPIEGKESLCVRFSDTEASDDEGVAILPESAFEIDLSQWLYEYVAVRIPLRHVHPDGECLPGMERYILSEEQAAAQREQQTDPRWDVLKEMK